MILNYTVYSIHITIVVTDMMFEEKFTNFIMDMTVRNNYAYNSFTKIVMNAWNSLYITTTSSQSSESC